MKRIISAVVLSGAVAFMGATGAQATTYPAPPPAVAVSDGTVAPGETITFSGTGFTPGETVEITVSSEGSGTASGGGGRPGMSVGKIVLPTAVSTLTTVADENGKFSTPVTFNEAGVYTLTAKGLTSGKTQTSVVTVVAAPVAAASSDAPEDALAKTGVDNGLVTWTAVGLGALALGAGSVISVRRKAAVSE